jgi:hypothetical protein
MIISVMIFWTCCDDTVVMLSSNPKISTWRKKCALLSVSASPQNFQASAISTIWGTFYLLICIFYIKYTVSFAGLGRCLEANYFDMILTTLEASFILLGSWSSSKNWLELKIEPPLSNLACLNLWNTLRSCGLDLSQWQHRSKICTELKNLVWFFTNIYYDL